MDDGSKIIKLKDFGASSMGSSSSATLKRTRGPSNAFQVPSCLVDGCRSDLSKCRDYHRRHKVCELHSKTPKVTIAGQEQRFCQQCSRFHSLVEFDEEKRSCRKRLDGHNRRRRKPQPESVSVNSGGFLSTFQGTRFSPFHSSQMLPSAAMTSALAMATMNSETHMVLYNAQSQSIVTRKNPLPASLSHSYTAGKEISFLQSPNCTLSLPESSLSHQSFMDSNYALNNSGSQKVFSEWLHRDNNVDATCALSLLSSTPTDSSKETGVSHHMVQSNSSAAQRAQSLVPGGLHYYSGLGMVSEPLMTSALVSDGSENAANLHFQEMFRTRPDGSSSSSRPHHSSARGNCIPP